MENGGKSGGTILTPNSAHDGYLSVDGKGGVCEDRRWKDRRGSIKYSAGFNYENKVSARLEKFALRRLHTRSRRLLLLLLLCAATSPLPSSREQPFFTSGEEGAEGERRVKIPSSLRRVSNKVPSLRFLLRIPANLRGRKQARKRRKGECSAGS